MQKKPSIPDRALYMHLLPILILPNLLCLRPAQITFCSEQSTMHGPHCKLGWFTIQQHQKHSLVLICYLFIFNIAVQDSSHHTVPSRCTATTTTPPFWMATMHKPLQSHHTQALHVFPSHFTVSQLAVQDGHQTHTLPVLSEIACVLQSHFCYESRKITI